MLNTAYRVSSARGIISRQQRPIQQKSEPAVLSSEEHAEVALLPPYNIRRELVLLYFKYVHDKHHSLFHQPSVEAELENGLVPEVLLYAMMALGAR